jgi:hypothetical protein
MDVQAKRLHLRLFLEGIEIPIISAMVQITINQPAVCSVQIVPLDEINEFKPRSLIHVFFYDFTEGDSVDLEDIKKYKLLFVGEVIGFAFSQSSLGRQAVLSAADFSSNWTKAYQYMITYGPQGNVLTPEAGNYAAGTSKFNDILDGHVAVLGAYLNSTPISPGFRNFKGLLGGIVRLIEEFGGVIGHRRGHNDFFTYQELRGKMMQQIVADENDNTANLIFQAKEFYEWIENGLAQLGELCTLQDMINLLFQYIYYERVPNPTAYFSKGNNSDERIDTLKINDLLSSTVSLLNNDDTLEDIQQSAYAGIKNIDLILLYPETTKTQKTNIGKAKDLLIGIQKDTVRNKQLLGKVKNAQKLLSSSITKLTKQQLKKIEVDRLGTTIFKPECYFTAAPRCNVIFPEQLSQLNFERNHEQEYTRLRLQSGLLFNIDGDKLLADYSYAPTGPEVEKLAKEQKTDRLGALLPWEKYTGVLPKFEYITELNYVASKKSKELQKNIQKLARSYKTRAANFNFYKYRFLSRKSSGSCRFDPFLVAGYPLVVISRPFMVDKDTLISKAKELGTDLNSVTSQNIIDNIKDLAPSLGAPLHYVGYPTSITHMADVFTGAVTNFTLSHARFHRIQNEEYLETYREKATKEKGKEQFKTVLDLEDLLAKGDTKKLQFLVDITPQTPTVKEPPLTTNLKDRPKLKIDGLDALSLNLRNKPTSSPREYPGDTVEQTTTTGAVQVPAIFGRVKVGSTGLFGTVSLIRIVNNLIRKINVNGKDMFAWRTAMVYEERDTNSVLKPLPLEEILRPSWFSPLYRNDFIGEEIYGKFFGCGSVVDELVYKSPSGITIQGGGVDRFKILDKLTAAQELTTELNTLQQNKIVDLPSMEQAIDIIAYQYGEAIKNGLDTERFINDYTRRPIATIEDILGSEDLEYRQDGNSLTLVNGKPGFHSIAVQDFDKLVGLLRDPSLPLPNRVNSKVISTTLDVRKQRREPILRYYNKVNQPGEIVAFRG